MLATRQLSDFKRYQQHQRRLVNRLKRAVNSRLTNQVKKLKQVKVASTEDISLRALRQAFDSHIPNEMTPDELFLT
jgi:hypothetical protein